MWITWANLLTLGRLCSIAPCVWAISTGRWILASLVFTLAVISDFLDGPVARRFSHATRLGGLLDHATDALFVSICLATLAWVGLVNVFLPVLVLAAFLQYTFDSKALSGQSLRTSWLGRSNGIAYFVAVGIPVIRNGLGWGFPPDTWIKLFAWVLVATSVLSMLDRAATLIRTRKQ